MGLCVARLATSVCSSLEGGTAGSTAGNNSGPSASFHCFDSKAYLQGEQVAAAVCIRHHLQP